MEVKKGALQVYAERKQHRVFFRTYYVPDTRVHKDGQNVVQLSLMIFHSLCHRKKH